MSLDCLEEGPLSQFTLERLRLRIWAQMNRVPLDMSWELTPYCNLNCPMCYVHLTPAQAAKRGSHLTAAQWLEIGRQFAEMGLMFLNLTGGEPLVRPDFWEIYEGVSALGIYPTVFTNGCLIDERAVEHFVKFPPRSIKLSLYGASDETYERMCGVKHGFEKVSRALELLTAAGIRPLVTTTIVKDNRADLEAMSAFADSFGLVLRATDEIVNSVRGSSTDADAVRTKINTHPITIEELKQRYRPGRVKKPNLFSSCSSYGRNGVITWNGHLQVCSFFEHEYVQLQEPFKAEEAWKELLERMDAMRMPEACIGCPDAEFCRVCPGDFAAATGHADRFDPSVCAKAAMYHKAYREALERGDILPEQNDGNPMPKSQI